MTSFTNKYLLFVIIRCLSVIVVAMLALQVINIWAADPAQRSRFIYMKGPIITNGGWFPLLVACLLGIPGLTFSVTRRRRLSRVFGYLSVLGGLSYAIWAMGHFFVPCPPPFQFMPATPVIDNLVKYQIAYWGPPVSLGFITIVFSHTSLNVEPRFLNSFCKHCAYNLTGNVSGLCPECGTPLTDEQKMILIDPRSVP